jgi:hypothetical protein
MFSRAIGSAMGVAVFGAIANAALGTQAREPAALANATHHVFVGVLVAAVGVGGSIALFPYVPTSTAPTTDPVEVKEAELSTVERPGT